MADESQVAVAAGPCRLRDGGGGGRCADPAPACWGAQADILWVYVCSTYRALAAEGTLHDHLEALSAQLGFTVGDITVGSLVYFLGAPTLYYQTAYPRVLTNWRRMARLIAEMAVIGAVCQAVSLGALLPVLTASAGCELGKQRTE